MGKCSQRAQPAAQELGQHVRHSPFPSLGEREAMLSKGPRWVQDTSGVPRHCCWLGQDSMSSLLLRASASEREHSTLFVFTLLFH